MKNIALIGMAGNMKAAVAGALARQFKMMPLDCYDYISFSHAATIEEIVKVAGMDYLEKLSSKAVCDAAEMENVVFCSGDITPLSEKDLQILKSGCRVVFLKASTNVIMSKYSKIKPMSSLLDKRRIDELNAVCRPRYEKYCDFEVEIGKTSLKALTQEITDWLNRL